MEEDLEGLADLMARLMAPSMESMRPDMAKQVMVPTSKRTLATVEMKPRDGVIKPRAKMAIPPRAVVVPAMSMRMLMDLA